MTPSAARACASGVSMIWCIDQRTFASTPAFSCSSGARVRADVLQAGRDVLEQPLDPASLTGAPEFRRESRLNRPASLVPEHEEERRPQVDGRVLHRANDFV